MAIWKKKHLKAVHDSSAIVASDFVWNKVSQLILQKGKMNQYFMEIVLREDVSITTEEGTLEISIATLSNGAHKVWSKK